MLPRIVMGLEAELGILGLMDEPGERAQVCEDLVRAIADEQPHAWGLDPKHSPFVFLANGAAFGPDPPRNVVPEYDTPECLSPFSLAASLTAGMRIVARAADKVAARRLESNPESARLARLRGELRLVAASMFYQGDDSGLGHHENYGVRWSGQGALFHAPLLPWIVTRQLLTEPGFVTCAEGTSGFGLSPRASLIERTQGESTTHTRAIFTTGRTAYARKGWVRLHVIAAGATLSPWAIALRHGGTALLLTMALRGWTPPLTCRIRDAASALRQVSLFPAAPIDTEGGLMTAHAISTELCDAVQSAHERRSLAPWATRLLAEWRLGLMVAGATLSASEIWLEHALRRRILSMFLAGAGMSWPEVRFWVHFLRLAERCRRKDSLPRSNNPDCVRAAIREMGLVELDRRLIEAGRSWSEFPRFRRQVERLWRLDIELNRITGGIADRQSRMRQALGAEVVSEAEIAAAEREPPDPTRARTRAEVIRKHFGDPALHVTWNKVQTSEGPFELPTPLSRELRKPPAKAPPARAPLRRDLGPLFAGLPWSRYRARLHDALFPEGSSAQTADGLPRLPTERQQGAE
jgi:hypothetical protein